MGHVLHAVIGPMPCVSAFACCWNQARLVPLPQGFALVPLSGALFDDIRELANIDRPDPFPGFERLSAALEAVLRAVSRHGALAYIETDYFGGCGSQSAVAWSGSRLLSEPFRTETTWKGSRFETIPDGERAINAILAAVGVWRRGEADCFDMLELGKFRNTDEIAEISV
jgi:hypothetical protein